MGAPRSQKADFRPIGFILQDQGNPASDMSWVRFNIRPEELSIIEPSRANVQQTLGGAWLDNFGPGVKQINMSGHTGWRAMYGEEDGFSLFQKLKKTVFDEWHSRRVAAIEAGRNPDLVQLVFVDELDEVIYVVVPMVFSLRRSKSRPLLMQYQINMLAVSDSADVDTSILLPPSLDDIAKGPPKISPGKPETSKSVVDSLRNSVKKLQSAAETIDKGIDRAIGQPTKAFMEKTNEVLSITTEIVGGIQGAVDTATSSLIETAGNLAQAGMNINQTIAAVAGLPDSIKARFMEVSAAYGNAACVLKNCFKVADTYPDYSDLYGSSYCSSTSGGAPISPLRDENPFYRVSPVEEQSPVSMSGDANAALASLSRMDVLETEPNADTMGRVSAVASGVSIRRAA